MTSTSTDFIEEPIKLDTINATFPTVVNGAVLTDMVGSSFAKTITSNTLTRPSDAAQYSIGDLVANSATATSVTAFTFANASSISGGTIKVDRIVLNKSGTGLATAVFRVHLYSNTPSTIANGDNAAWLTAAANYIAAVDITVDKAFSNGATGVGSPQTGSSILATLAGTTLYALIEAKGAYTPVALETFTLLAECYRF